MTAADVGLFEYLMMAGFCMLPVVFFLWGYAWWKRDHNPQEYEHYEAFCKIRPDDPHYAEKKIMEAEAICEARRHGRHSSSGPIVVEWDTRRNFHGLENGKMVTRGDYRVAIAARWLENKGPKNGIRVVRK
jgi:hypothetical protein